MSRAFSDAIHRGRGLGLVLLVGAVCVGIPACGAAGSEEEAPEPVPVVHVRLSKVSLGDLRESVLVPGRIAPRPGQMTRVSFQVPGRLLEVAAAEGQSITKGRLLARIDPQPYLKESQQAKGRVAVIQANLDAARQNWERNRKLFQRGIAAGREVEESEALVHSLQAELESAMAALANAELQVRRCEVFSDLSGIVVRRFLNPGEQVSGSPSDPVLEIANLDQVEMVARLPVRYLAAVHRGDPITVVSPAFPGLRFDGQIAAIGAQVEPETDTLQVRVSLANPRRQLKIGLFVEAELTLSSRRNVALVPETALVPGDTGECVFVAEGEVARKRPVTVGLKAEGKAEIVSGLSPGERVLISGNYGLVDQAGIIVDQ